MEEIEDIASDVLDDFEEVEEEANESEIETGEKLEEELIEVSEDESLTPEEKAEEEIELTEELETLIEEVSDQLDKMPSIATEALKAETLLEDIKI